MCRLQWDDVGERTIRYRDQKRRGQQHRFRFTPLLARLAEDLREWFLASGRPGGRTPVFPAHDGGFWEQDDWRNWRRRVWHGEPERARRDRRRAVPPRPGCAPAGTRPRDLRSSFVTLRVYEGVPLTQIAREVGTSVRMIEQHDAGVVEDWDGERVPAEVQIRTARQLMDPQRTLWPVESDTKVAAFSLQMSPKPSVGLEPTTPSLPWQRPGHDLAPTPASSGWRTLAQLRRAVFRACSMGPEASG